MPQINVTRSSMPTYEEYCEEIKELWESRWLTNMGAEHKKFEADLLKYLGSDNVKLYVNGHLALENILEAYAFPKGSEIITTPFTFASTTHSIVRSRYTPVMCDINAQDYTIDVEKIEELITPKTVAIMPVHVYGNMCDVERIKAIADKHGLKVIYDAAHAFAVTYKGVSFANYGDASMFSFHATKVFNSIEGGALFYRDASLSKSLDELKNFGIAGQESVLWAGGNAKMNEFAAAMGVCNLRHLDEEIAKRAKVSERYHQCLENVKGIRLNVLQEGVKPNYAYFPVVFDGYKYTRDEIFEKLKAENIVARKYFYPLINSFGCYKGFDFYGVEKTPVAKYISDRVLTLPMYADLSLDDVDKICDIILK